MFSSGIVKRFGVMVSNTVMFGSSSLLLLFGSMAWSGAVQEGASPLIVLWVLLRVRNGGGLLLRCQSLQVSLTGDRGRNLPQPHSRLYGAAGLCVYGRAFRISTVLGGIMVIIGAEVVRRPQRFSLPALTWAKSALPALENSKGPTP